MNSHEVFIHIHQGCFAGTGAIVRLPQCQWSKPDGYGKISQCITTTKHSKAKTVCIFLGIYCIVPPLFAEEWQRVPSRKWDYYWHDPGVALTEDRNWMCATQTQVAWHTNCIDPRVLFTNTIGYRNIFFHQNKQKYSKTFHKLRLSQYNLYLWCPLFQ